MQPIIERERELASTIVIQYTAVPVRAVNRKKFNGEFFHGRVVSGPQLKYDTVLKEDTICYRIQYNDGDLEDARRDELDLWKDVEVIQEFFTEKSITLWGVG